MPSLKYFIPDWNDKVDPNFDFQSDTYAPNRDLSEDQYAHEIFRSPPYDGILVSRALVEKSPRDYRVIQKLGAHEYYRLPKGLEVFGDCGAFSYVSEEEPRYKTEDVLDYYETIRVNYGASVDHLVVNSIYETQTIKKRLTNKSTETKKKKQKKYLSENEREKRIGITLQNATEFIRLYKKRKFKFTPIGVAQGDAPETYANSVADLLKMGYTYIAIGGIARLNALTILDVLKATHEVVREFKSRNSKEIRFHLFGVAKLDLINKLPRYGVASIDSASYLRKAWLQSGQNYFARDGKWYTAIRVPQSYHPRVREFIKSNGKSPEDVRSQEEYCLRMLHEYDEENLSVAKFKELLNTIVEYDTYLLRFGHDGVQIRDKAISKEKYQRTLLEKPWEHCPCEICKRLGIHVLIFRGTNRNKRRGFHNTWTFYNTLRSRLKT